MALRACVCIVDVTVVTRIWCVTRDQRFPGSNPVWVAAV